MEEVVVLTAMIALGRGGHGCGMMAAWWWTAGLEGKESMIQLGGEVGLGY